MKAARIVIRQGRRRRGGPGDELFVVHNLQRAARSIPYFYSWLL
jgi:hypothetical protein